jgi:hypothetical protein
VEVILKKKHTALLRKAPSLEAKVIALTEKNAALRASNRKLKVIVKDLTFELGESQKARNELQAKFDNGMWKPGVTFGGR